MSRNRDLAKLPFETLGGTTGQLLSKASGTDYDFSWIDNYTSDVEHDVKAGENVSKGNAVYISSADGTNMIVTKADYTLEGTSSKTIGLMKTTLSTNGIGRVITEGLLTGTGSAPLNTSSATAGDPVWLGASGGLLFGLANKPYAPYHMVFLGIVTRSHAVNGEIFVKVQNGFELQELHNVSAQLPNDGNTLIYSNTTKLWESRPIPAVTSITASSPLTGGTITSIGTIGIQQASGSQGGYLSSTDWSTFNGKQAALSGTGFVKISGTTISYDNSTYLTTISGISAGGDLSGTYPNPTIASSAVTLGKMANLFANSIIGNNTGSAATPLALTGTQVTAMLDAFTSTTKGLAPSSGGGTSNYLRADGTWATPPNSGGTVTSIATSSPLTGGTITNSGTIGIQQASGSQSGYLSANDWLLMSKMTSGSVSGALNNAGNNARIGTSNLSAGKTLTLTVYGEDAIKITTDVSAGPTFIDIAPGFTAGSTGTTLQYNGENFLSLTGNATGFSPSFYIYGSDGISSSSIYAGDGIQLNSGNEINLTADTNINISAVALKYTNGTNYVGFKLPTLAVDSLYTLPSAIPSGNRILQSDSSGVLTWITGSITPNLLTFNNGGTGDATGTTFNGSATKTISYNTIGAQPLSANLTSLAGLSYSSPAFVRMTGTNSFILDTTTYLTANQSITLSGDISGTGSTSINTTIGANKVTNAMLSQVATATFKGRRTAGTGNVEDLTASEATAQLDVFTSTTKGLAPLSGGGTTNFLRADGTWAAPSASGGMSIGGSITSATAGSILYAGASGILAQDNTNFFYDSTNKRIGIGQGTPTSRFHLNFNQNSVTQADANGILLANSTAAISGTQSISPAIVWQGNGWKTNATAGSQDVRFRADVLPVQGAANPTATWRLSASINGGAYTDYLTVSNFQNLAATGLVSIPGELSVAGQFTVLGGVISAFNLPASGNYVFRTTNGGSQISHRFLVGNGTSITGSGSVSFAYDPTNQIILNAGNSGGLSITRAAIQITNLTNTAGSESGDLILLTQSGGTAISEKMRIFAAGNVGIGTGSTNAGFKLDVNGTARFQDALTTTGRIQATVAKTSAYTLTATDRVILADTTTSAFTLTLPTASTGQQYTIVKTNSAATTVTIATTGAARINGATTYTGLSAQYKHVTVIFNGTDWFITSSN